MVRTNIACQLARSLDWGHCQLPTAHARLSSVWLLTYLLRCDEEGTVVSFINLRLSQNRNGPITEPGTLPLVSMPVQLLKRASNR